VKTDRAAQKTSSSVTNVDCVSWNIVNNERYSTMLKDKLKPAIHSKRRGLLLKTVLLHHDNARPHAAAATIESIQKFTFELLPHPPYSPNLTPSDSNKRCALGFATKQKHISVMELRSLLNVVKSVWISTETMKNDVIIMSVSLIFF
jgi:hypothetical protein